MINEQASLGEVFKDAMSRIDGLLTLICMAVSAFFPIGVAIVKIYFSGSFSFNWVALTAPVIIFLVYVRSRQLNAIESKVRQISNSMLIGLVSFLFVYALNF